MIIEKMIPVKVDVDESVVSEYIRQLDPFSKEMKDILKNLDEKTCASIAAKYLSDLWQKDKNDYIDYCENLRSVYDKNINNKNVKSCTDNRNNENETGIEDLKVGQIILVKMRSNSVIFMSYDIELEIIDVGSKYYLVKFTDILLCGPFKLSKSLVNSEIGKSIEIIK